MLNFINYITKIYISYKFEKKYYAYINEGKVVDFESAVQYAQKLKNFFEPFKLENISSKEEYKKLISIVGKNLTVLGKTNDILFLTNDLDKAQENVNYLQTAIDVLKQYSLDNSLDTIIKTHIANFDYIKSEVEIFTVCKNFNLNPSSFNEEQLFILKNSLNNLNNFFVVFENGKINKNNNVILKKLYDKFVTDQGPLILTNIVIINALANEVLSKNYSKEISQNKANYIADINKFLKEYVIPLSLEKKEDFFKKFNQNSQNFIELLPCLTTSQKTIAKNNCQEIFDCYITAIPIKSINNFKM